MLVIAVRFISHSNNFFRKVSAFFVNVNVMFVPIRWLLLVRVAVQKYKDEVSDLNSKDFNLLVIVNGARPP